MKQVPRSEVKDDLSKYLLLAEKEEIIITRHGKPTGILIGFESEDDWFDKKTADRTWLRQLCSFQKIAEWIHWYRKLYP
jgi:prevent-host-death family protein